MWSSPVWPCQTVLDICVSIIVLFAHLAFKGNSQACYSTSFFVQLTFEPKSNTLYSSLFTFFLLVFSQYCLLLRTLKIMVMYPYKVYFQCLQVVKKIEQENYITLLTECILCINNISYFFCLDINNN